MKKNNFGFLIALVISVLFSIWFNWIKPEKHTVKIPLTKSEWETESREYDTREYGDWYIPGTKLGEIRVHDEHGQYLGSVLGDPESATKYYWWLPEREVTFENALDFIEINAAWRNDKFQEKFGTNLIVGCLPDHYNCGGHEN